MVVSVNRVTHGRRAGERKETVVGEGRQGAASLTNDLARRFIVKLADTVHAQHRRVPDVHVVRLVQKVHDPPGNVCDDFPFLRCFSSSGSGRIVHELNNKAGWRVRAGAGQQSSA